jgi:hypothetical protein
MGSTRGPMESIRLLGLSDFCQGRRRRMSLTRKKREEERRMVRRVSA